MARLALRVAVVLAMWLVAGSALAQSRLVITEFRMDEERRYEDLIADELLFRNAYEIVPYEQFRDEVHDYGAELDEFLADPGLIVDLAQYLEYDAIVYGELDRRRQPRRLIIIVYDGGTGDISGTATLAISADQMDDEALDLALLDVEDWIAAASRPSGGGTASDETTLSFLEDDEPDSTYWSHGWLSVDAGLDVVQRNYTVTSADAGIQYDSGFYPGIEGLIDFYPVMAFSPGTLDGLGIRLRVARYFVDTTLLLEDFTLDVPTRHKEFGASLLYRHGFGPVEIIGLVGYEMLAFTLGDNDVYQSSEYSGLAVAVGGWYTALANLLRFGINVEIRPGISLGDDEIAAFGDGSSFGFALGAGVEVTPLPHFRVVGFYRFRQFSNTYDGNGESDLLGGLEGTDRFHTLGLRMGYEF